MALRPPTFLASRTGRFRDTSKAAAALDEHLTAAIDDLKPPATLPPLPATPANPGHATMTNATSAGITVKQLLEDHARVMDEIQRTQIALLQKTLVGQRETVTAGVSSVARQIQEQTDEFARIMGQFTNDLGTR